MSIIASKRRGSESIRCGSREADERTTSLGGVEAGFLVGSLLLMLLLESSAASTACACSCAMLQLGTFSTAAAQRKTARVFLMQDERRDVSVSWPWKIVMFGSEARAGRIERSFCLERTKALILTTSLGEVGLGVFAKRASRIELPTWPVAPRMA